MRYHELFERIDIQKTIDNYGDRLIDRIKSDHSINNKSIEQIIQLFIDNDPSPNQKYTLWMIRTYLNKGINYLEDLSRTNYALSLFDKFKNKLPIKDINQIKSLNQLEDLVDEFDVKDAGQTNKDVIKEIKTKETEYWYRGPEGIILVPRTERSSCFWGKNTRWCTASTNSTNFFYYYRPQGKLFIIIDKSDNKKYQFQFETKQFKNELDQDIDIESYLEKNNWVLKALMPYIVKSAKVSYGFAKNVLNDRFPEGENAIATNAKYSYDYALKILKGPFSEGEPAIAKNAMYSYMYALNVITGPFLEGEPVIATNAKYSYLYAEKVLKDRFPLGEKSIAANEEYAHMYVKKFLKNPFIKDKDNIVSNETKFWYKGPEGIIVSPLTEQSGIYWGEKTKWFTSRTKIKNMFYKYDKNQMIFIILNNSDNKKYKFQFELGRFMNEKDQPINIQSYLEKNKWIVKALMPYITNSPSTAYWYALNIIKGPFPDGEQAIVRDAYYAYEYARNILHDRFPLGEPAIATSELYSLLYAKDILHDRFPLGEKIMKDSMYWRNYINFLKEIGKDNEIL